MANKKVVVDPVTRIEGHLRMQAVLDENNVIVDAMSTGTMWRGLEPDSLLSAPRLRLD